MFQIKDKKNKIPKHVINQGITSGGGPPKGILIESPYFSPGGPEGKIRMAFTAVPEFTQRSSQEYALAIVAGVIRGR